MLSGVRKHPTGADIVRAFVGIGADIGIVNNRDDGSGPVADVLVAIARILRRRRGSGGGVAWCARAGCAVVHQYIPCSGMSSTVTTTGGASCRAAVSRTALVVDRAALRDRLAARTAIDGLPAVVDLLAALPVAGDLFRGRGAAIGLIADLSDRARGDDGTGTAGAHRFQAVVGRRWTMSIGGTRAVTAAGAIRGAARLRATIRALAAYFANGSAFRGAKGIGG